MAAKKMELGAVSRRVSVNIRTIRQLRGYSTRELSERLAKIGWTIRPLGITYIEGGQRRVDVDDLVALAIALNCSPNRLLLPQWVDLSQVDVEHDTLVVGEETRANTGDVWRWAIGEKPLVLKGGDGELGGRTQQSGTEAALWRIENQPHLYQEVIETLAREVGGRGQDA